MLCQECRKRPATVHVTRIVNGRKTETDLCEECAREQGELPFLAESQFSIQSFLAGILEQGAQTQASVKAGAAQRCLNCGLTYREFARAGRLGCSHCYDQLGDRLEPVLRRIHGASQHTGKVPARSGGTIKLRRDLRELRENLAKAVGTEDFELAANLRDQIRKLEKELE
jgi:protein arginine kinase activator